MAAAAAKAVAKLPDNSCSLPGPCVGMQGLDFTLGKAGPAARASLRAEISGSLADSQPAAQLHRRELVSMRSLI